PPTARASGSSICCRRATTGSGTATRVNTSSPYMVAGTPLFSTIEAASGSCHTLNSALAVALPTEAEPPMNTTCSIRSATSGYIRSSRARLVIGARATMVTGSADSVSTRRISSTACTLLTSRALAGRSVLPSPSAPCICEASRGRSTSGRSAPAATGTSPAPARSSTAWVLATTAGRATLPATQVTARTCRSGWRTAVISAIASSIPVSTSRMIEVVTLRSCPIRARHIHSRPARRSAAGRGSLARPAGQAIGRAGGRWHALGVLHRLAQPGVDPADVHGQGGSHHLLVPRAQRLQDPLVFGQGAGHRTVLGDAAPDACPRGGTGQRIQQAGQVGVPTGGSDGVVEGQVVLDQFFDRGVLADFIQPRGQLIEGVLADPVHGEDRRGRFQDPAYLEDLQHRGVLVQVHHEAHRLQQQLRAQARHIGAIPAAHIQHTDHGQ